jgi:hypothetical protein
MDVKILKNNKHYRVADLFFKRGRRWRRDIQAVLKKKRFKNTIMYDYLKTGKNRDYSELRNIILQHAKKNNYPIPKKDELVIHLRLGDMLEKTSLTIGYDAMKSLYEDFIENIDLNSLKISKITVVTALHFGANDMRGIFFHSEKAERNSFLMLEYLKEELAKTGIEVNIYSNENIDKDICYMVTSNYFIAGVSLFSDLLSRCISPDASCFKFMRERFLRFRGD